MDGRGAGVGSPATDGRAGRGRMPLGPQKKAAGAMVGGGPQRRNGDSIPAGASIGLTACAIPASGALGVNTRTGEQHSGHRQGSEQANLSHTNSWGMGLDVKIGKPLPGPYVVVWAGWEAVQLTNLQFLTPSREWDDAVSTWKSSRGCGCGAPDADALYVSEIQRHQWRIE